MKKASTKVELIRDIQSVLYTVDLHTQTANKLWQIIARAKKGHYCNHEDEVADGARKLALFRELETIRVARVQEIAQKVKDGYYDE